MGPGTYRRRILIATGAGWARADLEDDLHRVGAVVRHDGVRVTGVEGLPIRVPWSLCPQAVARLERLVGLELSPHPLAGYRHTPGPEQCTHMFDMAGLALAHAARGTARRQYDAAVTVTTPDAPQTAALRRDGAPVLEWAVRGTVLTAPQAFAGQDLRRLLAWAEQALPDPDAFEAVVVLRRAMLISGSRHVDVDAFDTAFSTGYPLGACYVYQEGTAERAARNRGSRRDFSADADGLLSDLTRTPPPDPG